MPSGIYIRTEENRKNLSKAWSYEKHFTQETKDKISKSVRSYLDNPINYERLANQNRTNLKKQSVLDKISKSLLGRPSPMKGRRHKESSKIKLKESIKNNPHFGMTGKFHTAESKYHIGLIKKGVSPPNKGKSHTLATRAKMSNSRKEFIKNNPDKARERLKAMLASAMTKPNKTEQKLIDYINNLKLPYKFVGDGKIWIGRLNPDFISLDGSNKIIEVFGEYWHTTKANTPTKTEEGRVEYFKQLGFS
ncbi:MAG: NUMOD3 domain-containing DNA-binding protein, partial [Nanoarchaeota archaeon]